MDIILKKDIKRLGYKHDVVSVKPGYARNYLIPQGIAMIASPSNRKMTIEITSQQALRASKIKQDAQDIATSIGELVIVIKTKAGESGKIFGSITPLQIAEGLKAKGFDVDRKTISIPVAIKTLGEYTAVIDLHREIKHEIQLSIITE
jgi:large subunit ribosomal protein L9